ncbi:MAG TPA: YheV family putative metal-binding protein [Pseudomonadales bacterium]
MPDKRTLRRFIAGAVCPECRALDRIVVEEQDGERRRRCVSCGFTDTITSAAAAAPPTRFTRRAEAADEPPPTPVKILDPRRDR